MGQREHKALEVCNVVRDITFSVFQLENKMKHRNIKNFAQSHKTI